MRKIEIGGQKGDKIKREIPQLLIFGRFYYLIFQTGASRQNLIRPRLSAFVSCKINDLV